MNGQNRKVVICAALAGAFTTKQQNPAVPYTPAEFAGEAAKCYAAGAAMVHVHARDDQGYPTHEINRIRATHDAIKDRTPELIVNLSSAVGVGRSAQERLAQILAVEPAMASLNTNTMNFSIVDRNSGEIILDGIFENTFTMLRDFGSAMEAHDVKPEIECYDMGGVDNALLIAKQGFFTAPMNFNFVWGVAGGQRFRPDAFIAMVNALPAGSTFTTCGVGLDQFPAVTMSCLMGGHMRVGLEDNIRLPNGDLAKGSWEQVLWSAKIASALGREPASPDEARKILGIRQK